MSTPRTDAKLIEVYDRRGKLIVTETVHATFARRLEVELNAALNEIGELRKVIVELTAAGNCVESDKMNLAMAIRDVGGKANVKWSTDNWNNAKDWDRRKNGTI